MKSSKESRGLRFAVCGLLILMLSIFTIGCGGEEDEETNPADVPSDVMSILRDDVGYKGEFLTPDGSTYDKYDYDEGYKWLDIVWKDSTKDIFDSYKAAWEDAGRAIDQTDGDTLDIEGFSASIAFYASAGEIDAGYSVEAGSIVFSIVPQE